MPAIGSLENAPIVDGTSAHSLRDAGLGQARAFELRQNQIALWSLDVAKHAENVDFEVLQIGAGEDRAADPLHSWADLVDGHQGRGGRKRDTEQSGRTQGREGSSYLHVYVRERGSQFSYTDQVLAGQAERW